MLAAPTAAALNALTSSTLAVIVATPNAIADMATVDRSAVARRHGLGVFPGSSESRGGQGIRVGHYTGCLRAPPSSTTAEQSSVGEVPETVVIAARMYRLDPM